jgi:hypothetical protein
MDADVASIYEDPAEAFIVEITENIGRLEQLMSLDDEDAVDVALDAAISLALIYNELGLMPGRDRAVNRMNQIVDSHRTPARVRRIRKVYQLFGARTEGHASAA